MSCSCHCHPAKEHFTAEVCIHFPGIENLGKPSVFIFPSLSVCLECGVAEFVVNGRELQELKKGFASDGQADNGLQGPGH